MLNSYVVVHFYVIYSCDDKAVFSASLLQSSVSRDPSEIILFMLKKHFSFLKCCAA